MSYLTIEKKESVAIIWMDQPNEKVNVLNTRLIEEFKPLLESLEKDPEVKAIILASKKADTFIAGADLDMLKTMEKPADVEKFNEDGNAILNRISTFPKPVVAAIHGSTLGGGLEVALAAHYRIATDHPKTKFALPEVKLGLLPGGGGTQRLPRLIGLQKTLDIILTGKNVYPHKAKKIGLIDELVNKDTLFSAAREVAQKMAEGKLKPKRDPLSLVDKLLEKNYLGRSIIYSKAKERVLKQTQGNYPAPLKILECVQTGMEKGFEAGRKAELRNFTELVFTPESRNLINLFFQMQEAKKNPGKDKVKEVREVGILGAGLMGSGIANVTATNAKIRVNIKDQDIQTASNGLKSIWKDLEKQVGRHQISEFERDQLFSKLTPVADYKDISHTDLIIEAVFEDLNIKKEVVEQTESVIADDCIFASNTSSLPISQIAADAKHPERILGMHYFSPVPKMPLLEIIKTDKTEDWVVATAYDVGLKQGKTVIVVNDGPGFYTTRILAPYMNEALTLLKEHRASIKDIDKAMVKFGFPVGPVKLIDEIGIDVGAHVTEVLREMFEKRGVESDDTAQKMVEAGYKGRKNKKGFYDYSDPDKKSSRKVNERIYQHFGGLPREKMEFLDIQERLNLIMINEAAYCLQEGILTTPRDGDLGAILGLGYPPFLGGPFHYIDAMGADKIVQRMEKLAEKFGPRFQPAQILKDHAAQKKNFYEEKSKVAQ
ncbi:MAG TPA: fatty acid oxidation complex subunit alpha FadJ [Balneolales bacterium]|nr:fatty acid oxidation complex subunit alpha FadJ [Balneolales bacterium]